MRRTGVILTLVAAVAACGGSRPQGPAWPKSAGWVTPETWEEDGGESIAPRSKHLSAVESSAEPVQDDAPDEPAEPADPETPEVTEDGPDAPRPEELEVYDFGEGETIVIEGEPPEAP